MNGPALSAEAWRAAAFAAFRAVPLLERRGLRLQALHLQRRAFQMLARADA